MAEGQVAHDALNQLNGQKLDYVNELDSAMELWLSYNER